MLSRNQDIRCFCARKPLLGVLVEGDERYLHIKIYKASRIFGELKLHDGIMDIRCRDCLRWHTVEISKDKVKVAPSNRADMVDAPIPGAVTFRT